jgi:NAD(P)-dependent dehydrogenase (short-subunit alcohol dehydrogenase family)
VSPHPPVHPIDEVAGHRALVTGATPQIGLASAHAVAAAGGVVAAPPSHRTSHTPATSSLTSLEHRP